MYCLAKNPEKQQKLRDEITSILKDKDAPLSGEIMNNMPYLRAVIKEGLRLFPPNMVNIRRTFENLVIKGYQVPKGIDIMMNTLHMFKDECYFGNPNEFIPERWLRKQDENVCPQSLKLSHPFAYLPFGYGARFCVGKRIAEMELEVMLTRLVSNYKLEWHHADLEMKAALVVIPDGDLKFRLIKN